MHFSLNYVVFSYIKYKRKTSCSRKFTVEAVQLRVTDECLSYRSVFRLDHRRQEKGCTKKNQNGSRLGFWGL